MWGKWKNPHIHNGLIDVAYPNYKWWIETTDTIKNRGQAVSVEKMLDYSRNNQLSDQHISVFAHDKVWKDNADKGGSVTVENSELMLYALWIELDRKDHLRRPDYNKAVDDAIDIVDWINDQCDREDVAWVFSSGNNSAHILIDGSIFGNPIFDQNDTWIVKQLAHEVAGNVRFGEGKPNVYLHTKQEIKTLFRKCYPDVEVINPPATGEDDNIKLYWSKKKVGLVQQSLENIDPNLYSINSLIRQPFSYHEKGKAKKSVVYGIEDALDNFGNKPPFLLDMWFMCAEEEEKRKSRPSRTYEEDYILETYSLFYPDILTSPINANGFYGPFYSVLYDDSNPGVYIHHETGYHKDFGSSTYSVSLWKFKQIMGIADDAEEEE